MLITVSSVAPIVINEMSRESTPHNVPTGQSLTIRDTKIVNASVEAPVKHVVIVDSAANYAPQGPPGDPGIHVGSEPPEEVWENRLWVKI